MAPTKPKVSKLAAIQWTRQEAARLIEMYEAHECLYAMATPDYHNRNMRQAALEEITEAIRELRPEATPDHLKAKVGNLRTHYVDTSAKLVASRVSDCSTDSVALPTLWCFESLRFLEAHIIHTKGRTNLSKGEQASSAREICEREESQDSTQYSEGEDLDPDDPEENRFDTTFERELRLQRERAEQDPTRPASAVRVTLGGTRPASRCSTPGGSAAPAGMALASGRGSVVPAVRAGSAPPGGPSRAAAAHGSVTVVRGGGTTPASSRGGAATGSSRGARRPSGVSISPGTEETTSFLNEARASIADLVSQRMAPRVQVADPLFVQQFGTRVGTEMLILKKKTL